MVSTTKSNLLNFPSFIFVELPTLYLNDRNTLERYYQVSGSCECEDCELKEHGFSRRMPIRRRKIPFVEKLVQAYYRDIRV